jgi:hypothetical protein
MNHAWKLSYAAALVATGALLATAASRPQDKGAAKPPAGQNAPPKDGAMAMDPAMMEKMMKLATPGEAHAELAKKAGSWETHIKVRMSPDMPWMESDGKAEKKSVLGGRYLEEDASFSMMGMPMQGLQLIGFDNKKQEYISLWADTGSTWWATLRGKKAADGSIEFKGMIDDGAGERPFRMVVKPKGPDEEEVEMYDTIPPKGDVLMMTLSEKRKK